ncbi:MAG: type I restriction endonuclease subunit M [Gemmatimonadota bacterium]
MVSPRRTDHSRGPLFRLGQLVATPGAIEVMERLGIDPLGLIARHVTGDWGDIHPEDRGLNEQALRDGSRIFSVYGARDSDDCLWVITEAQDDEGNRLATTIPRPVDY